MYSVFLLLTFISLLSKAYIQLFNFPSTYSLLSLQITCNVIGKHHDPWSFLSDLILAMHHHYKQTIQKDSKPILGAVPPSPLNHSYRTPHRCNSCTVIIHNLALCSQVILHCQSRLSHAMTCTTPLLLAPCHKLYPGPQTHNVASSSDILCASPPTALTYQIRYLVPGIVVSTERQDKERLENNFYYYGIGLPGA